MRTDTKQSTLRERLGNSGPGLTVAVAALVVALCGGAFAATGAVTSKSKFVTKTEATKIAKKYAGKNGADGKEGPAGKEGAAGKDGQAGAPGQNGKSVVIANEAPFGCAEVGLPTKSKAPASKTKSVKGKKAK